jgi:hypothetical protein
VHVLEAALHAPGVAAVVSLTRTNTMGSRMMEARRHRETERLDGCGPCSNRKGWAELIASAYRRSFSSAQGAARVISAGAGNAIVGGELARWAGARSDATLDARRNAPHPQPERSSSETCHRSHFGLSRFGRAPCPRRRRPRGRNGIFGLAQAGEMPVGACVEGLARVGKAR